MSTHYLNDALTPATQREALPGQVANSGGGFSFAVDDWTRLDRFLVLGTEGGSYYATQRTLTRENAAVVERCLAADGKRTVRAIVEISKAGRAPKNDQAILALAMAARKGDDQTRAAAYAALPAVCRTGTHLYMFVNFATQMGGWGRGLRRAVGAWLNERPAQDAAYQAVKYQQRDGWSMRDLLRLSHPTPRSAAHGVLYDFITNGEIDDASVAEYDELNILMATQAVKRASTVTEVVDLIRANNLPREVVPTQWLNKVEVWEALLAKMPMGAMLRNIAKMTRVGLIAPLSQATELVTTRLANQNAITKARLHPLAILNAQKTYQSGHGQRGGGSWSPVPAVIDALDAAFYLSFGSIKPTGKAHLLALDISASMTWSKVANSAFTPREASAAMALVTAAVEPRYHVVAFSDGIRDAGITAKMRLSDAIAKIERMPASNTDCALPMIWAMDNKAKVDGFVIYTDSETNGWRMHPSEALRAYRKQSGIDARSVVVGMIANQFTVADPNDSGMLDVVGFDTSAPSVISDFIAGGKTANETDDSDDGEESE